jgi:hypothetical protein
MMSLDTVSFWCCYKVVVNGDGNVKLTHSIVTKAQGSPLSLI